MTADDVREFLALMDSLGISIWLDGGWAVDACLGSQTRSHADLDIALQERDVPMATAALRRSRLPAGTPAMTPARGTSSWATTRDTRCAIPLRTTKRTRIVAMQLQPFGPDTRGADIALRFTPPGDGAV
ncbi:hypothetical protein AB0H88_33130 [Nonomuraea sp. NPDC050680]|uniref:nucleotidyltransferase domain-containing protein n=1 Tax=Nonomuraea sp. NPDC050680 TaxID=3154630 RepID=UPI0033C15AFA